MGADRAHSRFARAARALLGPVVALALAVLAASEAPGGTVYPPDTQLTPIATDHGRPRPAYLTPTIEPPFGTEVTRIADPAAFDRPKDRVIRHAYAKNQPWNADSSLLMLDWDYPAPLLDGRTYELIRFVHQPSQAIWLNTDPRRTIGTDGNKLVAWDMVRDRRAEVLERFRRYREIDLGSGEGNLSSDDRYAALFGLRSHRRVDLVLFDLERGRTVARRTFRNASIGDGENATFNNVTMAQSGKYVVAEFNGIGYGPRSGVVAYDRRLRHARELSGNGGSHYDACTDSSGADSIVAQSDHSTALVSVRMRSGRTTRLLGKSKMSEPIHISCRNVERPGWTYISEFAEPGAPRRANSNEVIAVRLDGSHTVERFAKEHHSRHGSYVREPHAVPSRDGSRVLWASDWERPKGRVLTYVARQP